LDGGVRRGAHSAGDNRRAIAHHANHPTRVRIVSPVFVMLVMSPLMIRLGALFACDDLSLIKGEHLKVWGASKMGADVNAIFGGNRNFGWHISLFLQFKNLEQMLSNDLGYLFMWRGVKERDGLLGCVHHNAAIGTSCQMLFHLLAYRSIQLAIEILGKLGKQLFAGFGNLILHHLFRCDPKEKVSSAMLYNSP
jgi:hypothetical protein